MPNTLAEVGGLFWDEAQSVAAYPFGESSGNAADLWLPSRNLALVGTGAVPIQRVPGHVGKAARWPDGASQLFDQNVDETWNALGPYEHYLSFSGWAKTEDLVEDTLLASIWGASAAASQWNAYISGGEVVGDIVTQAGVSSQAITSGVVVVSTSVFYHFILEFGYNGKTGGAAALELRLMVNGTAVTPVTAAEVPVTLPVTTPTRFLVGSAYSTTTRKNLLDSFVFRTSRKGFLSTQAKSDLYNGGFGVALTGPGESIRNRGRRTIMR